MTSTAQSFTTTRRPTHGVYLRDVTTFGYIGVGILSYLHILIYGARCDARSFHLYGQRQDGVMTGDVTMKRMRNTVGEWYSFKSRFNGRLVYLRADALLIVEGHTVSVGDFWLKVANHK